MGSYPKLGSLEARTYVEKVLGEHSQGERGAESWVEGREVAQGGGLH